MVKLSKFSTLLLKSMFFVFSLISYAQESSEEGNEDEGFFIFDENQIVEATPTRPNNEFQSSHHIGLGLGYGNSGVTRGLVRLSEDSILKGKVPESVWSFGLIIDLGWDPRSQSGLRTKWQWGRSRLEIGNDLRSQYPADSLEEMLQLFMVDFILRKAPPEEYQFGVPVWIGAGFSIQYAFGSSTGGAGSGRISKLRHSTSVSPVLALGVDLPMEQGQDFVMEMNWHLINAYKILVGLRTQL